MEIRAYKDMQSLHTFGVPWEALVYCAVDSVADAVSAIEYAQQHELGVLVLGGGSNILPTKHWNGLVLHNKIAGREITDVDTDKVTLRIGAGEQWHALVEWTVGHGYYGLENLALIPGSVGGAVVQNIGAYDVDIERYIQSVEAIEISTGEQVVFGHDDCDFDYRTSVFKQHGGRYMVTHVTLALSTVYQPVLSYRALAQAMADVDQVDATEVMKAVIDIRQSKLPDWHVVGTAGSFFANPRVDEKTRERLVSQYPDVPVFNNYGSDQHTVPAAWLIEHAGLDADFKKQYLYHKHHLVLVNQDKGGQETCGSDLARAAETIASKVDTTFGIALESEVVIL